MTDIRQALRHRILVLDGAMGTMLQSHGLQGNGETFNLTNPDIVAGIHREYVNAGADIITTNSFCANRISQHEYGLEARASEFAFSAARIAREVADSSTRKVWVAGSVGPTGRSLSLAQDVGDPAYRPCSFDEMADAFEEQMRGLVRGGVDLILFETCFDALNTKAGIYALRRIPEAAGIPIMISASISDRSGRTLTGQTTEAFYRAVSHACPMSFGLNCSMGAEDLVPLVREISSWAECAVSCHPNAGLPNEMGEYDETPEMTAGAVRRMAMEGCVNIVGGCCGTTPAHVRAMADAVRNLRPREIPGCDGRLHVSGLESVVIDRSGNFTNVGERTNVSGSRKFARLIAGGEYEEGLRIAARQIEDGASVIDVNMDDAMLDSTAEMERFLRHISNDPSTARAALMIDSSHWATIVAGLKSAQGKCIVNSISLKEGEEVFLSKAREIRSLGAAVIVIAFDENGQATTFARKTEICARAYRLLVGKVGFTPSDIIFDVNVLPVGTGMPEHARYGIDFIDSVRWIKENLPGAMTSGGISNLSFAFRGNNAVREAMHSVFLYHAIEAGLDMGIVNPGMLRIYDQIEPSLLRCVEDVILDSDSGATERLIARASREMEESETTRPGESRDSADGNGIPVGDRLIRAIVSGDSTNLETDLMECLATCPKPIEVIDGPLMNGMARVGELFGDGRMFLPQVLKSARTMKSAVAFLQPFMDRETADSSVHRPSIVLATVKGDVHDIGKNITSIVMNCNGLRTIDLGVMVPKEEILAAAESNGTDLIGVSGLITPSLYQMEEICREMASRGMTMPLLVGGAATSALHTAVKLAPLYGHVFHSRDASAASVLAMRLVTDRQQTEDEEHRGQERLRELHARSDAGIRSGRTSTGYPAGTFIKGTPFGNIPARELSIDEVMPYFDWTMLYAIWGIRPGNESAQELDSLRESALDLIGRMKDTDGCRIMISARFDPCHSEGDDIVSRDFRLPMLRQEGRGGKSLADFVPSVECGTESQMGMFAVGVHPGSHTVDCDCPSCTRTDFESILHRSVMLTLAEAASEWLTAQLNDTLEGLAGTDAAAANAKVVKPAVGYACCPDHTLKRDILRLLPDGGKLNITILDSCAMIPHSSICGLIFIHPDAGYPEIRHIGRETLDKYAARRGMSEDGKRQFLEYLL